MKGDPTLSRHDSMIRDFIGQLLVAKAKGWNQTRPARYSAMLAGLTAALHHRHAQWPGVPGLNLNALHAQALESPVEG